MLSQQTDNGTYGSTGVGLLAKTITKNIIIIIGLRKWASSGDLPLSVGVVVALLMLGKQCLVPVHI